ncbi:hypothetical protein DDN03_18285 [Vibrio cholerae]|nr:hypothetical protein [Vibrio cholerae]
MVTVVVIEFSGMRCQPLRRALGENRVLRNEWLSRCCVYQCSGCNAYWCTGKSLFRFLQIKTYISA